MPKKSESNIADRNFVLQQGFELPVLMSPARVSSALRFQPRIVGLIVLAGMVSQSPAVFAGLAALLWGSALRPRSNPFDVVHNLTLGLRAGAPRLTPAPMPRRFAQGTAATFSTAGAAAMVAGFPLAAMALQSILLLAVAALVFAKFCPGSFVYHLLRGHASFAMATLPWRRAKHTAQTLPSGSATAPCLR